MNKKEKAIIKECWKEIKKQAITGSGIHLSVQVLPDYSICVVVGIDKFGRRWETGKEISNPKKDIEFLTKMGLRTKKLTKKEAKKLKLIK